MTIVTAKTSASRSGKVITPIVDQSLGDGLDAAKSVLTQPDGKIVLVGDTSVWYGNSSFALARYNSDGTLDTKFGKGGKAVAAEGSQGASLSVSGAVLQTDGKIVVTGSFFLGGYDESTPRVTEAAVLRFNKDGTLDKTFGGDGKVSTPAGDGNSQRGEDVALQADGKILVSGSLYAYAGGEYQGSSSTLARYNADGSLDASFGKGGQVTTRFDAKGSSSGSIAVQPDGKIILSGSVNTQKTGEDFALARYNADGSLDKTFGQSGKVLTKLNAFIESSQAVVLQPDGKILVCGESYSSSDFMVLRYNANGSLDKTFGKGGKAFVDIGKDIDKILSMVLQSNGKIVLGGTSYDGMFDDFTLARLNANGSLDTSFGKGGKVVTPVGPFDAYAYSVALQPDGRIVLSGYSDSNSGEEKDGTAFALVRYNADGSLDRTFGDKSTVLPLFENDARVLALQYRDGDDDRLSWSITGGPDAKFFSIDPELGHLTFNSAPDFEAPKDSGRDNVYDVTLKISDGKNTRTEALSVRVDDVKSIVKIGKDTADVFVGDGDADTLKGRGGNDELYGKDGNDRLYGGDGDDRLYGGDGSGFDSGDNRLDGGAGKDRLTGGTHRDTFVFNTKLDAKTNVDVITGRFSHKDDTIELSHGVFAGLKAGTLEDFRFKVVDDGNQTKGVDKSDRILYDKHDGDLFFDRDGSGTKYKPVKFAEVRHDANLDHTDFLIV